MKHIKSLYEKNTPLYKNYIITDFNTYYKGDIDKISSGYYIFKILPNSTETKLYYDAFYYVSKLDGKLITTNDNSYYTNYKNNIFDIIYQTNSLKEATEILYTLISQNKFNL